MFCRIFEKQDKSFGDLQIREFKVCGLYLHFQQRKNCGRGNFGKSPRISYLPRDQGEIQHDQQKRRH